MTQSNFQGKAQPPQPCGFKIQPPGSHCQLALSLGFVTVLALTSSPSKFGPPHWLGHGLRPCPSANLAGQLLPNPGRYIHGFVKTGSKDAAVDHSSALILPRRIGQSRLLQTNALIAFLAKGTPGENQVIKVYVFFCF